MELVKSLEEIRHNIAVLDSYLDKKTDPEYSYALGLVKEEYVSLQTAAPAYTVSTRVVLSNT